MDLRWQKAGSVTWDAWNPAEHRREVCMGACYRVSLVETRREPGHVHHRHRTVLSLGLVHPAHQRAAHVRDRFWDRVAARLTAAVTRGILAPEQAQAYLAEITAAVPRSVRDEDSPWGGRVAPPLAIPRPDAAVVRKPMQPRTSTTATASTRRPGA